MTAPRIPANFTPEIPRDRNGWPLIMNAEGTKRQKYRRTTKWIDVLEDTWNLDRYKQRMVLWGAAQRDDLIVGAAACHVEDRATLNDLAWQAQDYARSQAKANTGTALHKMTERLDRGEVLGRVPEPHGRDLKAYEHECKRYKVEQHVIESFRVHDGWRVAGTTDRIWKIDGVYYIVDIKTGDIDWGALKMAMQLAMYRHSVPYDIATDTRSEDTVQIHSERAVIVHLPSGEGHCEFHWIDIRRGWNACRVAKQVWEQREVKRGDLIYPMLDQGELPINTNTVLTSDRAIMRAGDINTVDELRDLYHQVVSMGANTPEFTAAIKARKTYLLQQVG